MSINFTKVLCIFTVMMYQKPRKTSIELLRYFNSSKNQVKV